MGIARRESLSSGCSTFSLGFLCATGKSCNSGKAFRPLFWILRAPHTDCPHSTISPVAVRSTWGPLPPRNPGAGRGGTEQPPGRRRTPRGSAGTGTERVRTPYGLPTGYRRGRSPSSPVPSVHISHLSSDSRLFVSYSIHAARVPPRFRVVTTSCYAWGYVYATTATAGGRDVRRDAPPPNERLAATALRAAAATA
jgi:hypothetical protein